ncbi:hypothetical protein [Roseateles puraquae]|uniref:hypothetical protein n=1 Tax=Roseateles puraquae TaxID=431059 RepID=UPI0031D14412
MRRLLALLILPILLAACGGGGSPPAVIPEAQAAEPPSACPAGDATAQLQSMVDTAKGVLELPACVFNTSAPILISKPLRLVGAAATVNGTIIRSSADEAVVIDPAVRVAVAVGGWNQRGFWAAVENLRIEPTASGGGKHALVLRVRPGFFISSWLVDRVHLGDFGEQGLLLENPGAQGDGIFTGQVSRSYIENGVKGTLIGDSVWFYRNSVTNGPSRFSKPGLVGFDISLVAGAAETVIEQNNITTTGGCVLVRSGIGIGVLHNWCETSGAPAVGQGLIQLNDCQECTVRDNRVQTMSGAAAFALAFSGGGFNVVESNKLTTGKEGHISFAGGAHDNALAGLNRYDNTRTGKISGAAALISTN